MSQRYKIDVGTSDARLKSTKVVDKIYQEKVKEGFLFNDVAYDCGDDAIAWLTAVVTAGINSAELKTDTGYVLVEDKQVLANLQKAMIQHVNRLRRTANKCKVLIKQSDNPSKIILRANWDVSHEDYRAPRRTN